MAYNEDNPTISGLKKKVRLANKLQAREFVFDTQAPPDVFPLNYTGQGTAHQMDGAFRLDHATALMECSALCYVESPEEIRRIGTQWGFSEARAFDRKSSRAVMLGNDEMLVIAFRGCDTKMETLRAMPGPFKTQMFSFLSGQPSKASEEEAPTTQSELNSYMAQMPVHGGAAKYLDAINGDGKTLWQSVDEAKKEFLKEHPHAKVYLTGHSLGGSLALLGAGRMIGAHEEPLLSGLYTFGQPRVGKQDFVDTIDRSIKDRYFRVVDQGDWIAGYPGVALAHGGHEVKISPFGAISMDGSKAQELAVCALSQKGVVRSVVDTVYATASVMRTNSLHHTPLAYLYNLDFATRTRDMQDIPQTLIGKRELAQRSAGFSSSLSPDR